MTYTDDTSELPELPTRIRIIRGTIITRYEHSDSGDVRTVKRHIDRSIIVFGLYITNRRPRLYTFVHDGWPWFVEARLVEVLD